MVLCNEFQKLQLKELFTTVTECKNSNL